eukprot:4856030-Prymnesium_polylepis.2
MGLLTGVRVRVRVRVRGKILMAGAAPTILRQSRASSCAACNSVWVGRCREGLASGTCGSVRAWSSSWL